MTNGKESSFVPVLLMILAILGYLNYSATREVAENLRNFTPQYMPMGTDKVLNTVTGDISEANGELDKYIDSIIVRNLKGKKMTWPEWKKENPDGQVAEYKRYFNDK